MSGISVYAHIRIDTGVTVSRQQDNAGEYVTLEAGDLAVFIHSREKLLEIASLLEQAAQKWEGEALRPLYTAPQPELSKFLEKEEWNDAFAQGFNAGFNARFNSDEKPAPDVSALVEALEDIAGTHHHSASAGEYFAKVARAALAAYRKQGGGRCMKACAHQIKPHDLPLQRNALRVEAITPGPVCALRPKTDQFGRRYEVLRWVGSGGDPATAAMPCVGGESPSCPRRVIADDAIMNNFKSGPCPVCRTMNRRDGYGTVACRDCGLQFTLVAESFDNALQ